MERQHQLLHANEVLHVGTRSFVGVFVLTLFAIVFLRVTVCPIHVIAPDRFERAFGVSIVTGVVLSAILMAGKVLLHRVGTLHRG